MTEFHDHDKARRDAEWLAGSELDNAERNLARAYLALRAEVASLTALSEERYVEIRLLRAQLDAARAQNTQL